MYYETAIIHVNLIVFSVKLNASFSLKLVGVSVQEHMYFIKTLDNTLEQKLHMYALFMEIDVLKWLQKYIFN